MFQRKQRTRDAIVQVATHRVAAALAEALNVVFQGAHRQRIVRILPCQAGEGDFEV